MRKKSLIEINPLICFGKPVFSGTRIPVYMMVELIAAGKTTKEILKDYYPSLSREHVRVALQYAAKLLENQEVIFSEKKPHAISL